MKVLDTILLTLLTVAVVMVGVYGFFEIKGSQEKNGKLEIELAKYRETAESLEAQNIEELKKRREKDSEEKEKILAQFKYEYGALSTRYQGRTLEIPVDSWLDLKKFGGRAGYYVPLKNRETGETILGTASYPPAISIEEGWRWIKPAPAELGHPELIELQMKLDRIWVKERLIDVVNSDVL